MFVKTKQVHGDDIHIIDKPVERVADIVRNAAEIKCDAIITNQRHIGIGVVTAD